MARKQTERMNLRMTPEQKSMIFERVIQAGCPSINHFVVKMCSTGQIVSNDALREINKELHYQGNNLNQLTRLAPLRIKSLGSFALPIRLFCFLL